MLSAPTAPALGERTLAHDQMDGLVDKLQQSPLTRKEARRLIRAQGTELVQLLETASLLRDVGKGTTVTYSRKVFIPLTNLCRDKCGYCTFAKPPSHPEARTLSPEEVLAIAEAGRRQGCKEALFTLGDKPELRYAEARAQLRRFGYSSTVGYLAAMCDMVFRETRLLPHVNCGVLEREDLLRLREVSASMGLMLENVSERLLQRGQAHYGCATKVPSLRMRTMETAAELGIAFTSGILVGIGETPEERVDSLFALKDLQARAGNVQEVIVQNFRAKPDIRMRGWSEPSTLEMLRTLAVARLVLGADQNIQAPPNLTPDAYPLYLLAGINDWGGVSPVTIDHVNPEHAWPQLEELRARTAEAGFELRERLCLYPSYLSRPQFVREGLRPRIEALVDSDGLVKQEETR